MIDIMNVDIVVAVMLIVFVIGILTTAYFIEKNFNPFDD